MPEGGSGQAPAPEPARRHLGGGVLASVASQLAVLALGALTSVAIARVLGPSGTGSFALAASFFAVALLVAGAGIKQGIIVLVGSGRWSPGVAVRDLALPVLASGLAGVAISLGIYELGRDSFLAGLPASAVPALALAVPFGIAWQWSSSLALARERYEPFAVLQALPTLLALVIAVTLAIASGTAAAVIGFAAAQVAAGTAAAAWTVRRTPSSELAAAATERPPWRRLAAAYRVGLLTWASELLQFVNFRFDLFFLAGFAATGDVGVYSVAATVTSIALLLPQSLAGVVLPRSAALEGAAGRGELTRAEADLSDARAARHTLLLLPVSAVLVGALLVVGIPLLYGSRFDQAIELGLLLLPGTLVLGLAKVFSAVVVGRGYPRYLLYTVLFTMPPTVAAYLIVIPDAGSTGAALVSSGCYMLTALLAFIYFRRVTGISARDALLPRRDDLRAYPQVAALTIDYIRPLREALGARRGRR